MKATHPFPLLALFAGCALLTWAILRDAYAELPPLPWTAVPTLSLMALGEAYTASTTRARIRRSPGTRPIHPLTVARLAAFGKASAYGSAALAGVFGGFLLHVLASLDRKTPRHDAFVAGGTLLAALALTAAALWLEYACRVPTQPGKPDDHDAT